MSAPTSSGPRPATSPTAVHVLPLRIYYEDTDAAGIVYYANWLRFLERGRTELLRLLGQEHSALREERGVNWVVRRCTIDYLKPARLDETIEIVTELRRTARRLAGHDPAGAPRRRDPGPGRARRRLHGRRRPAGPIAAACADCPGPGHAAGRLAPLTPYSGINL